MTEFCSNCDGVSCLKVKGGVYMKKDKTTAPEIITGKIDDCLLRKRVGQKDVSDIGQLEVDQQDPKYLENMKSYDDVNSWIG